MIKTKRVILSILSLVLVISFSSPTFASTDLNTDFNIDFNKDKTAWEYTQVKNGEKYKIVEELNETGNGYKSLIYIQNEQGDYVLDDKVTAEISKDGSIAINSSKDGEVQPNITKISNEEVQSKNSPMMIKPLSPTGDPLTSWLYSGTTGYSIQDVAHMTIGTLATAIAAKFKLGARASIGIDAASSAIASNFSEVYTHSVRYYKNVKGTTILAGIKERQSVYTNSSMNHRIKGPYIEVDCASGYACEY